MGDYLNTIDRNSDAGDNRSERSSNATDISFDSRSSERDIDDDVRLNRENRQREEDLLEQKYNLIKDFNKGRTDADIYWFRMAQINEELQEINYENDEISNELINQELIYVEMMDNINEKIKKARQLNKKLEKGFVDSFDYSRLKVAHKMLKKLRAAGKEEEEEENLPFDYDTFDLEKVAQIDRVKYEKELKLRNGVTRPDPDSFRTQQEYEKALESFYDSVKQMLLLMPFEDKEKKEIISFAKKHHIQPPSIYAADYKEKYSQFLTDVAQLLPGYIFKMMPTKIGFEYVLLKSDLLGRKVMNELADIEQTNILLPQHSERFNEPVYHYLKTKPVEISDEDKQSQENRKELIKILNKIEKDELINCIFDPGNEMVYKRPITAKKLPKAQQLAALRAGRFTEPEFVNRETIKLKGRTSETAAPKSFKAYAQADINIPLEVRKRNRTKEFARYQKTDFHRRILTEVVKMYNIFEQRRVAKGLTRRMQGMEKYTPQIDDPPVDAAFMNEFRNISKARLLDAMRVNIPIELLPYTGPTLEKLEDYIFKISENSFLKYSNKIEDIVFIFEYYPNFKTKLLTPIQGKSGNYTTEINIYQLALFEKEISIEARIHIYPINVTKRRKIIEKIIFEFKLLHLFKSEILEKEQTKLKAKEIDLMLFNLSSNESEYLSNANRIIEIIRVRGRDILTGEYLTEDLIQTLNIFNKNKKDQELLFERYLNETEKGTGAMEHISYKDFIKKILPDKTDYSGYSVNQLKSVIDDYSLSILELEKRRKQLDSINFEGDYLLYWIPPSIVAINEKQKWENIVMELRELLQGDSVEYYADRRSGKYRVKRDTHIERDRTIRKTKKSFANQDQIIKKLKEANDFKQSLAKKYRLEATPEHLEIVNEIIEIEDKIEKIEAVYNQKRYLEQDEFRKKYIQFLKNKYPEIPQELKPKPKEIVYENITPALVNQLVQAYKRQLLTNEPGILKEYGNTSKVIDKTSIKLENFDYLYIVPEDVKFKLAEEFPNAKINELVGDINRDESWQVIDLETTGSYPLEQTNPYIRSTSLLDIVISESQKTLPHTKSDPVFTKRFYSLKPENSYKNMLLTYLELYDLNEYFSKTIVNGQTKTNPALYTKIKNHLSGIIGTIINIKTDFASLEAEFKKKAIQNIYRYLGIADDTGSINEKINKLANGWPKVYKPQTEIIDFYGHDLFKKAVSSNYQFKPTQVVVKYIDSLDFYNTYIIKDYEALVKSLTKNDKIEEYRRYGILFNVGKGTFGDQAYDGQLFDVELLDKNFATGLPMEQVAIVAERDPRTGTWIPVQKTTYKRGPYAFIKRSIGTNQIGEINEVWQEVPRGSVKLYKPDYDSCNRFLTQRDCKGIGMGGKDCRWEPIARKCSTSAFGQRKKVKIVLKKDTSGIKYKLSDSVAKRRSSLIKRIAHEKKKKKCTLRQAAIAVKRRLVVLRTYRKNSKNKKQSLILSKDIKYIDSKYIK
jgi:hypothetical protein